MDISHTIDDFLVKDVSLDTPRQLLFGTSQELDVLSRARQWYVDGIFKVVGQPFYQLFSVHAFIRSSRWAKKVPLAFALMSRRTTSGYIEMFNAIKSALVAEPAVECITTDFKECEHLDSYCDNYVAHNESGSVDELDATGSLPCQPDDSHSGNNYNSDFSDEAVGLYSTNSEQ